MRLKIQHFFLYLVILITAGFSQTIVNDIELPNADGERVEISEIKGSRFTIIEFWTTWCLPCHQTMKELIEIYPEIKKEGGEIIGINADAPRNLAKVKPFLHTMNVTYPVLLDTDAEFMSAVGATVFPTLLLLNDKNEVVFTLEGYSTKNTAILQTEIHKLISGESH